MSKFFISRQIDPSSAFAQQLAGRGIELFAKSLIDIRAKSFGAISEDVTWLFFYSANGVRYFKAGGGSFAGVKTAVLGKAGARAMMPMMPNFVGNGEPIGVAATFAAQLIPTDMVVFVQATHSQSSVQKRLPNDIKTNILEVYDNVPNLATAATIPICNYLLFTSPMNVTTYIRAKGPFLPQQRIFAIGQTTAAALADCGAKDIIVAPEPDIESLGEWLMDKMP